MYKGRDEESYYVLVNKHGEKFLKNNSIPTFDSFSPSVVER